MEQTMFCMLSAMASLYLALRFVHVDSIRQWYSIIIVAMMSAGIESFIQYVGIDWNVVFLVQILPFLLGVLLTQIQTKKPWTDMTFAFFISFSQFALMYWLKKQFPVSEEKAYLAQLPWIMPLITIGLTIILQKKIPKNNWSELFEKQMQKENMNFNKWKIYAILSVPFVLEIACGIGVSIENLYTWFVLMLVGYSLFWGTILLLIVIQTYKGEQLTALLEQQYREDVQSFMNVIRSQRHDYNFHVQSLAGLIRSGDMKACLDYVNALEQDTQKMNAILPIQDPAISAMINNFQTLAAREGIQIHTQVEDDLSLISTNVYETNKIIGNLLQNAIDEVKHQEDKSYGIWMSIIRRHEYCVIRVSNQVEREMLDANWIGQIYRQGYTTKQGHDGVGLSSVQQLVRRYKGVMDTRLEGTIIHFVVRIPICYRKQTL